EKAGRDEAITEQARATRKALEANGEVLKHPVTGAPLTGNEQMYATYEEALQCLNKAGVKEVHVGGSFVTKKPAPHDIDFMWNAYEKPYDRLALQNHDFGALLQ